MLLNKHRIWGSWGLIRAVTNCSALWLPSSQCLRVPKAGDLDGQDVLVLRVRSQALGECEGNRGPGAA